MATESKFQHLMHRNTGGEPPPQLRPPQNATDMSVFNNFDTNLSVEAKAFRPNQGLIFADFSSFMLSSSLLLEVCVHCEATLFLKNY